jgi:hypothetical protein
LPAHLIQFGDPAVGVGGDFETECARELTRALPDRFLLLRNLSLPRGDGFYECDLVVVSEWLWEIVEAKAIRPTAEVFEDSIRGFDGFVAERVFSLLDAKARILAGRRQRPPFPSDSWLLAPRVRGVVVLPNSTDVRSKVTSGVSPPAFTLKELVERYLGLAREKPVGPQERQRFAQIRACWERLAAQNAPERQRNQQHLGRYLIGKRLPAEDGTFEYLAYDTYPCKVGVHLKEIPFDPTLPVSQLQAHLVEAAREMVTLRRIRHPHVGCVIGHFSTGASLVQVTDWFDGEPLDDSWKRVRDASITQRIGLCSKIADALAFCHERNVFHRDISARNVLITPDLEQVRVTGFRLAKDLNRADTLTSQELAGRDPRLLAPEELKPGRPPNARLTDIYQAGVLFYRILEEGEWPAESTYALVGGADPRPMTFSGEEPLLPVEQLLREMLAVVPELRPDPMRRVEARLWQAASL